MAKPMTKKLLLGIPTVTLSAVLAYTVAGCGGIAPSGSAGSSGGGSAPVEKKAYKSQTVEAAYFTFESVAGGVADSGEKADLTGIDCASYSIEAADGYTMDSSDEDREKAGFFHDETGGRLHISIFPRSPQEEVASLEQIYEGKETTTDQVDYNGTAWLRFTGPDKSHTLFATAPATGETVRVSIGWKIDWDAAVPMMEALKLK